MFSFTRKVQYYETDQMGVVHHSNYVRWLEEVRTEWMESVGMPYHLMESHGILSPVLSVNCTFKFPARYGDSVTIKSKCISYNSIRFKMEYEIFNQENTLLFIGSSEHFFTNMDFRPISLARAHEQMHNIFSSLVEI